CTPSRSSATRPSTGCWRPTRWRRTARPAGAPSSASTRSSTQSCWPSPPTSLDSALPRYDGPRRHDLVRLGEVERVLRRHGHAGVVGQNPHPIPHVERGAAGDLDPAVLLTERAEAGVRERLHRARAVEHDAVAVEPVAGVRRQRLL